MESTVAEGIGRTQDMFMFFEAKEKILKTPCDL